MIIKNQKNEFNFTQKVFLLRKKNKYNEFNFI